MTEKHQIDQSDIEVRRKRINRRLNLISIGIVLIAGIVGVFMMGDRANWQSRGLILLIVVAWVAFRLVSQFRRG